MQPICEGFEQVVSCENGCIRDMKFLIHEPVFVQKNDKIVALHKTTKCDSAAITTCH